MPTVRFPAVMKYYVNNQAELSVPATNVGELISTVIENYPSVRFHLVDAEGNLRRHFNVFVNGTHIRELSGMDTTLTEDDKVILMASAAGGSSCHCEEGALPDEAIFCNIVGDCFGLAPSQ